MSGRALFVAVGAAATVAGLAVALRPSLAVGFSPTYIAVTLVGALALLQATGAALGRLRGDRRQAEPPEVERRRVFPTPGAEFDRSLASLPRRARRGADRHRLSIRNELREATEGTLVRYAGLTPEEASDRIEAGTWTDDARAVSFFAPGAAGGIPLTERVRDTFAAEQAFVRRARAVVGVLGTYSRADRTTGDSPTSDRPGNGVGGAGGIRSGSGEGRGKGSEDESGNGAGTGDPGGRATGRPPGDGGRRR